MPGVVGRRPGADKPKVFDSLDAVSSGRPNPNPDVVVRKNGVLFDNPPAKVAKAEVRKAPLSNAASKPKAKRKFNKPVQSAGGGKVKRIRAEGAKATRAKSVLSNNPSDDKLG